MATALAAVRLQPWPQLQQHEVVPGPGSAGVSVRAFGGYPAKAVGTSYPRGRICRVPLFRTSSSSRREALSEDHDITDMQETDKVSGEWWKPILTAVHGWSKEKLLGLAELADGSLFFSFGPGSDSKAAKVTKAAKATSSSSSSSSSSSPQAKAQSDTNSTARNLKVLPPRHPSSFRKHSPIPAAAAHKKVGELRTTTAKAASPSGAAENKKPEKKERAKSSNKAAGGGGGGGAAAAAAQPRRPPSSFFKRSPIPKDRVPASASKKKVHETDTPSTTAAAVPAKESPFSPELKEVLNHGKDGAKSAAKTSSTAGAPAKKKVSKAVVKEEPVVEVTPTSSEATASTTRKKTSNAAVDETEKPLEKGAVNGAEKGAVNGAEKGAVNGAEKGAVNGAEKGAENGAVSEDLGSYKLPELRSLAKARGLKGYSKLKKGDLLDLLTGSES